MTYDKDLKPVLFNTGKSGFALSGKDIQEIRTDLTLSQLPTSPPYIRGFTLINEKVQLVADFCRCTGCSDNSPAEELNIIIPKNNTEKLAGFCIAGSYTDLKAAEFKILPVPEMISAPEILAFILIEENIYPLFDLSTVYQRTVNGNWEPGTVVLLSEQTGEYNPAPGEYMKIQLGGRPYLLERSILADDKVLPVKSCRLPGATAILKGVVKTTDGIRPVLGIGDNAETDVSRSREGHPLIKSGQNKYVLDIDPVPLDRAITVSTVKALPHLLRNCISSHTGLFTGGVLPILDPLELLLGNSSIAYNAAAAYQLERDPLKHAGEEDLEVVEFTMAGLNCALPARIVSEVIPPAEFSDISDPRDIIKGLLEHRGELLPVLDLAPCFSLSSTLNDKSRMAVIKNGDFSAALILENYQGSSTVPVKIQQNLPIGLPHNYIYECHPVDNMVRLVLNAEALAIFYIQTSKKSPDLTRYTGTGADTALVQPATVDNSEPAEPAEAAEKPVSPASQVEVNTVSQTADSKESVTADPVPADEDNAGKIKESEEKAGAAEDIISPAPPAEAKTASQATDTCQSDAEDEETPASPVETEDQQKTVPVPEAPPVKKQKTDERPVVKAQAENKKPLTAPPITEKKKPDAAPSAAVEKNITRPRWQWQRRDSGSTPLPGGFIYDGSPWHKILGILAVIILVLVLYNILAPRDIGIRNMIRRFSSDYKGETVTEYRVKKGDTLSEISRDIAGDKIIYPRIADDNDISDPHVIMPRQKIIIRKAE